MTEIPLIIAVAFWAFMLGAILAARASRGEVERAERMGAYWRDLYWKAVRRRGQTIDVTLIHPPQDAQYRPGRLH